MTCYLTNSSPQRIRRLQKGNSAEKVVFMNLLKINLYLLIINKIILIFVLLKNKQNEYGNKN